MSGVALWAGFVGGLRYLQNNGSEHWLRAVDWLYVVWARWLITVATFLFILPVLAGRGRLIRFILGNRIMEVMGRLSYCIYLVHLVWIVWQLVDNTVTVYADN